MKTSILDPTRLFVLSAFVVVPALATMHAATPGPATPQVGEELAIANSLMTEPGTPLVENLKDAVAQMTPQNARLIITLDNLANGPVKVTVDRANGKWQSGTAEAPRFNKASHVADASGLTIDDSTIRGTLRVSFVPDAWVPADKQPRNLEIKLNMKYKAQPDKPWVIEGSWQGIHLTDGAAYSTSEGSGTVTGTAERPAGFLTFNDCQWENGLKFTFDLGTQRVNWNRMAASLMRLENPANWTGKIGLRIGVHSPKPRTDAALTVWLMEEDGSWYYCKDAVPLADAENRGIAYFSDFVSAEWAAPGSHMDENHELNQDRIAALAIGVVNPLGIGKVDIVLTELSLVGTRPKPSPVNVTVTGTTLSVNNHDFVPPGIFGGYAPNLPAKFRPGCQREYHTTPSGGPTLPKDGESFIIDMWGDRTYAAPLLTSATWKETLEQSAKSFAEKAKEQPKRTVLEFWNEPYLDWAKSKHYIPTLFDQSKAVDGGEVHSLKYGGVIPHYRWRKITTLKARNPVSGQIERVAIPPDAKAGDTFKATVTEKRKENGTQTTVTEERTFEVVPTDEWKIYDETQFTYWSGRGNGFIYDEMAKVVAKTVNSISPQTPIAVGWGFRWNEDHWAAWEMLYKPTIESTIQWIDGLHEHHYQGDTTAMVGSYEVATAYGISKHNRWLYSYNTETGDIVDLPARGKLVDAAMRTNAKDYRRMVYVLRDCLYAVAEAPDKLKSRTEIHTGGQWTDIAFGMLSDLRGRLVQNETSDPKVWCAASIDGTDPDAMPADGKIKLVVFVWNDYSDAREVNLKIAAPTNTRWAKGPASVASIKLDPASLAFDIVREDKPTVPGKEFTLTATISPHLPLKVEIPLEGTPSTTAEAQRRQFFAGDILQKIGRNTSWKTSINLDADTLKQAKRAWLRLVVEGISDGEAVCQLGDRAMILPRARTHDNANRLFMIPVDTALLSAKTPIVFSTAAGNHDGYQVDMASIVLETTSQKGK